MRLISVEPMSKYYRDKVLRLLENASFTHRHLDWHSREYWLDKQPGFVYLEDNHVNGFISCCEGPDRIAWVHLFSVAFSYLIHNSWRSLFDKVLDYFSNLGGIIFAAIPLDDSFQKELEQSGFRSDNKIIVFHKPIKDLPSFGSSDLWHVSPYHAGELSSLLDVDQKAFPPLWQLTREAFLAAANSLYYSTKVVHQGKVIAYQLSTQRGVSVHLARIAVLPEYRGKGIARTLLDDLFIYAGFNQNEEITVNTQSDNAQSIQLYSSYGFVLQPESYPVYTLTK